jgi:hypothetical protein
VSLLVKSGLVESNELGFNSAGGTMMDRAQREFTPELATSSLDTVGYTYIPH